MTKFSNIAVDTNFASSITDAETSKAVGSATGWPEPPFNLKCEDEVIRVGAKSGTTFSSMTRGYDGTTAAAHTTTPNVTHVVSARDVTTPEWVRHLADRTVVGETVHAYDDEFDDESIHSDWTSQTVSGNATWTEARDRLCVAYDSQTTSDAAAQLKALDSLTSPLTIETVGLTTASHENNSMFGLVFSDGTATSSNAIFSMPFLNANAGRLTASFRSGTLTNLSSTAYGDMLFHGAGMPVYQRLIWSAANSFKMQFSLDGVLWIDHSGNTASDTLTPTYFGLYVSSWAGTDDRLTAFEYFRVTESDLSV